MFVHPSFLGSDIDVGVAGAMMKAVTGIISLFLLVHIEAVKAQGYTTGM